MTLDELTAKYEKVRLEYQRIIVDGMSEEQYIAALKQIRTEGTDEYLVSFFFTTAINHMEEDIKQKKQNTKPKLFLF